MHRNVLRVLASLRLTVALLAASMVLVFVGTLAQVRIGVWEAVDAYFRSPVAWIDLQLLIPESLAKVSRSVPFPGGATIGALLLVNLLAAHAARFKLTPKRAGIVLLHAGLIVLIVGEFVTARYADEGLMSIDHGETVGYVEDLRSTELALTRPVSGDGAGSAAGAFETIPARALERSARTGEPVSIAGTPMEVTVLEWIPNARLLRASGRGRADQGVGLEAFAERLPSARGVDGAQTDAPAAYVRLSRAGEPLGTWLLWANLIEPQTVVAGDATFGLALRYRRTHKPYELTLLEFRHDTFVGTTIARNFSSRLRLVDRERGVDREVLIWMNNPLRYRGDTFYQASYKPDGTGTILQVVRNPGAVLPYVACVMVGGGLLVHFVMGLTAFMRRRERSRSDGDPRSDAAGSARERPSTSGHRWPAIVGCMLAVALAFSALLRPAQRSEYDLRTFAELPVSSGGRVKPFDSAARHLLMVAGGRQSATLDGEQKDAVWYMLGLMGRPEAIADVPVVRVDHPEVLALLGLTPEMGGRNRLALSAIEPHWDRVSEQARAALQIEAKRRDPFQRAVVKLYTAVDTLLAYARMREPYLVPPLREGETWRNFHEAFMSSSLGSRADAGADASGPTAGPSSGDVHPGVAFAIESLTAYSRADPDAFNSSVRGYREAMGAEMPDTMRRMRLELLFNRARLFAGTTAVYLLAFLLLSAWLLLRLRGGPPSVERGPDRASALRVTAVAMLWAALAIHTLAIVARVYLQGRPPVTNLYSSAVFVGWAAVLFGMVLERLYPIGIAALGAATIGFGTLIVAHNLGSDGDTMQMMQAVLDSNFWLATHVVTITLGYSATFLAGALGAAYVLLGVFTRRLSEDLAAALGRMVYGVVCFALLLSFVGTVLGGIWADQSWGRFWGWDPKENGAALVVLLNAIILHARWCGLARQRGIMLLAVGGNIVTAWSWFGTNMLGVGLHAYGFMDSAAAWLLAFVGSQILVIGLGLTPQGSWRSRSA